MRWRWILGTVFVPLCLSGLDFTVEYSKAFGFEPMPQDRIPPALGLVTLLFVTLLAPGVFVGQWLALRHRVPAAALWLVPGLLVTFAIPFVGMAGEWIGLRSVVAGLLALLSGGTPGPTVRFVTAVMVVALLQGLVAAALTAPVIAAWNLNWRRWVAVCLVAWASGDALMSGWREWGGVATVAVIGSPLRPIDPSDKSWPADRLTEAHRKLNAPELKPSTTYHVSPSRLLLTTTIVQVGSMLAMWLTYGWITAQFFWWTAVPGQPRHGGVAPSPAARRRRVVA